MFNVDFLSAINTKLITIKWIVHAKERYGPHKSLQYVRILNKRTYDVKKLWAIKIYTQMINLIQKIGSGRTL